MLRLGRFLVPLLVASLSVPACDSGDGDGDADTGDGDAATETGTADEGMDASASGGDGDGDAGDGDAGDGDSGDGDGDSGDGDAGDGDTGDGDSGDGDGDGDSGDAHAETACLQFVSGTPTPVTSVMTQADANQVVLTPSTTEAYQVTLNENPKGGYIGWVNMSVPDWGSTQAIFVGPGVEYELFRNEGMTPISKELNLACPETGHSDERIFFPHWDDAQIRFTSSEASEVWFMFFKQD